MSQACITLATTRATANRSADFARGYLSGECQDVPDVTRYGLCNLALNGVFYNEYVLFDSNMSNLPIVLAAKMTIADTSDVSVRCGTGLASSR